ncbi:hypothetical protein DN412_31135 [Cupriavidus lacunae]|uniref:Uncharacterized protein n=1 Tax=Cupriavidus lacunae TaxID=2666307 RepID=A0A370NLP2_9BURK|nr:hypothetical protein DN412_31135 [Cupriavidus lacunae]
MARPAFCRQTPKVGARCPNWARRDLCGGCSVMSIPTAITRRREARTLRRPSAAVRKRLDVGRALMEARPSLCNSLERSRMPASPPAAVSATYQSPQDFQLDTIPFSHETGLTQFFPGSRNERR